MTSLVFGFGILIGFIYNYFLYNVAFDIDIFNYIEITDLIFSWISTVSLLLIILITTFLILGSYYFYNSKLYNPSSPFSIDNFFFPALISILTLMFIYIDIININITILSVAIFLIYIFVGQNTFKRFTSNKNGPQVTFKVLILFYVPLVLYFAYSAADNYSRKLLIYDEFNLCNIRLIRNIDAIGSKYFTQFVGRTSTNSIFLVGPKDRSSIEKLKKYIYIINNADISNVVFYKNVMTTETSRPAIRSFFNYKRDDKTIEDRIVNIEE